MKKSILYISIVLVLGSCLKDEPFKLTYQGYVPQSIHDDWQVSDPETENMNRALLNTAYELLYQDKRYLMARSLLVFRNGKLVAEAYPNDPNDIHEYANIQSCTRSIRSTLIPISASAASPLKMRLLCKRDWNLTTEATHLSCIKRKIIPLNISFLKKEFTHRVR